MIGALVGDDRHRRPAVPVGTDQVYYSDSFWVKITTLPIAIAVRVHDSAARHRGRPYVTQRAARLLVGALSIALWVTVAAAGRWIGFS